LFHEKIKILPKSWYFYLFGAAKIDGEMMLFLFVDLVSLNFVATVSWIKVYFFCIYIYYLSTVFFNLFAAAEPSTNVCIAHRTLCNDPSVFIATTA